MSVSGNPLIPKVHAGPPCRFQYIFIFLRTLSFFQAVRPDGLRISFLLIFIAGAVGLPTAARPHLF